MNNNTIVMDTILYGATIGNVDGVTKLVEMMSASKPKPSKSKPKKKPNSNQRKLTITNRNKYLSEISSEKNVIL